MSRGEVAGEMMIPEKARILAEAQRCAGMAWFWNRRDEAEEICG